MTLVEYISALRRYWILILALGVFTGGATFAYAQILPKEYGSRASVMVIPARGDTTGELVQGSNYVQNLVQTYTLVASSPVVLSRVIAEVGLDEQPHQLARRIRVETPLNTVIINIDVTEDTPEGAQKTANSVASVLAGVVRELSPQGEGGKPVVRIQVIAPARLSTIPVAPNTRLMALLGVLAGIALGVGIAVGLRVFGTRLTSPNDLAEATNLPLLGEVPMTDHRSSIVTQILANPAGRVAEALRSVVVALRFIDLENAHRVILVTSPSESEGKTSITLGLSLVLAEAGHSVLFVEGDLRRPSVGNLTQLDSSVGLSTVLVGDKTLNEAAQQWGHENLRVLLSGELPPNPGQLLSSERTRAVLADARGLFDLVIVDGAPILPVSDSRWLATRVDGTIMIARLNRTRRKSLAQALASFETTQSPVLGVIANGTKDETRSTYYKASTVPNGTKVDPAVPPTVGHDETPSEHASRGQEQ